MRSLLGNAIVVSLAPLVWQGSLLAQDSGWWDETSLPNGAIAVEGVVVNDEERLLVLSPGTSWFGDVRSERLAWLGDAGWETFSPECPVSGPSGVLSVAGGRLVIVHGGSADSLNYVATWVPGRDAWSGGPSKVVPIGTQPVEGGLRLLGRGREWGTIFRWHENDWVQEAPMCELQVSWEGDVTIKQESGLSNGMFDPRLITLGDETALYAECSAKTRDGTYVHALVRRHDDEWVAVGSYLNGQISDTAVFTVDGKPRLIAAGEFTATHDGRPLSSLVALIDGEWQPFAREMLGDKFHDPEPTPGVFVKLAVVNEPAGPALYVFGRDLRQIDGVDVVSCARWCDGEWSPLGDVDPERAFHAEDICVIGSGQDAAVHVAVRAPVTKSKGFGGVRTWYPPGTRTRDEVLALRDERTAIAHGGVDGRLPRSLRYELLADTGAGYVNMQDIDANGRCLGYTLPRYDSSDVPTPVIVTSDSVEELSLPEEVTRIKTIRWDYAGGILATLYTQRDSGPQPYRYADGVWTRLQDPDGGTPQFAYMPVSDKDGRAIGAWSTARRTPMKTYRFEADKSAQLLPGPEGEEWIPIDARGEFVLGSWSDAKNRRRICVLKGSDMTTIEFTGDPVAINESGSVVGTTMEFGTLGTFTAFRYQDGAMQPLAIPGVGDSCAVGVLNGGATVIAKYKDMRAQPPFYIAAGQEMVPLDSIVEGLPPGKEVVVVRVHPAGLMLAYVDYKPAVLTVRNN